MRILKPRKARVLLPRPWGCAKHSAPIGLELDGAVAEAARSPLLLHMEVLTSPCLWSSNPSKVAGSNELMITGVYAKA